MVCLKLNIWFEFVGFEQIILFRFNYKMNVIFTRQHVFINFDEPCCLTVYYSTFLFIVKQTKLDAFVKSSSSDAPTSGLEFSAPTRIAPKAMSFMSAPQRPAPVSGDLTVPQSSSPPSPLSSSSLSSPPLTSSSLSPWWLEPLSPWWTAEPLSSWWSEPLESSWWQ